MPEPEVNCEMCKRPRAPDTCEVLTLTAEEQAVFVAAKHEPRTKLVYCRPCFRLLSNQTTALEMMTGIVETKLRASGVPDAERIAIRFKMNLIAKSKSKLKKKS